MVQLVGGFTKLYATSIMTGGATTSLPKETLKIADFKTIEGQSLKQMQMNGSVPEEDRSVVTVNKSWPFPKAQICTEKNPVQWTHLMCIAGFLSMLSHFVRSAKTSAKAISGKSSRFI